MPAIMRFLKGPINHNLQYLADYSWKAKAIKDYYGKTKIK